MESCSQRRKRTIRKFASNLSLDPLPYKWRNEEAVDSRPETETGAADTTVYAAPGGGCHF